MYDPFGKISLAQVSTVCYIVSLVFISFGFSDQLEEELSGLYFISFKHWII